MYVRMTGFCTFAEIEKKKKEKNIVKISMIDRVLLL